MQARLCHHVTPPRLSISPSPSLSLSHPSSSSSLLLSSLELSDTKVYEPNIRARLEAADHFCKVVGHSAASPGLQDFIATAFGEEIGTLLPNNQRQHRTLHIQKDVLPHTLS